MNSTLPTTSPPPATLTARRHLGKSAPPTASAIPWIRSDDPALDRCRQALDESGYGELRKIHLIGDRSAVELIGTVGTYFMKQLSQEMIRPHVHGRSIRNHVQVIDGHRPYDDGQRTAFSSSTSRS